MSWSNEVGGATGCRQFILKLCRAQATSIARSEKPSLVLRRTSFTIRQRLTPAMVFSTMTRAPEISSFIHSSSALKSLPFGFFWLKSQDAFRFITLEPSVLAQSCTGWVSNGMLVNNLFVVFLTHFRRAQVDYFSRMHIC